MSGRSISPKHDKKRPNRRGIAIFTRTNNSSQKVAKGLRCKSSKVGQDKDYKRQSYQHVRENSNNAKEERCLIIIILASLFD